MNKKKTIAILEKNLLAALHLKEAVVILDEMKKSFQKDFQYLKKKIPKEKSTSKVKEYIKSGVANYKEYKQSLSLIEQFIKETTKTIKA